MIVKEGALGRTLLGGVLMSVALVSTFASVARAQRTDVLVLQNGDRVTGEISNLRQGILEFKTDNMGTLHVEWHAVRSLKSSTEHEVEFSNGLRMFGALSEIQDARLQIQGETESPELGSVVGIEPLKKSFWSQINGSMDLGYNFAQSNAATSYNANAQASYRTRKYLTLVAYNGLLNSQEGAERSTRNNVTATLSRFLSNRWGLFALSNFLQSTQLAVDLRSTLGGGVLRQVVDTRRMILMPLAGVVYSRSNFTDEAERRNEALLLTGVRYDLFTFGQHKTDLSTSFLVLPSLTESGHVRLELENNLRIKLFRDLYWSISLFDNFDNDPPPGGAENDFGISTSLGWQF